MELESHFTCVAPDVIRIAGTRVGIETIISDYEEGASPEEMVMRYPTVSLDQVHAAITYYLANRSRLKKYLHLVRQTQDQGWLEQMSQPPAFIQSLRERIDKRRASLYEAEAATATMG